MGPCFLETDAGSGDVASSDRVVGRREGIAAVEGGRTRFTTDERRLLVEEVLDTQRQRQIFEDMEPRGQIEIIERPDGVEVLLLTGQAACAVGQGALEQEARVLIEATRREVAGQTDRKSTRLNSS